MECHLSAGPRPDNRSFTSWAWFPVVAGQQMSNESVDFQPLVRTHLAVFIQRNVLAPTDFLRGQHGLDRFKFQSVVQLTLRVLRHGPQSYSAENSVQRYFGTGEYY